MAGYNGYSMSNNAVHAYGNGERPISKWTKAAILAECGDKADMLKALTVSELRQHLLLNSSWHHTSEFYNRTEFYSIDEDKLEQMTQDDVQRIIAARAPRTAAPKTAPKTITAEIKYTVWEGRYRNYRRPVDHTEIITYTDGDKMIETQTGAKRMSSVTVLRIIEEK